MKKSSSSNAGANLAIGGTVLSSGAGSAPCSLDDTSFTCQLNKGVKNLQNLVFVFGVLYFAFYAFKHRKNIF
jgi:hypothetical protein